MFTNRLEETEEKQRALVAARENDRRGTALDYQKGDEVLVYWTPFQSYSTIPRKQCFRYEGPYVIDEVLSPYCVKLHRLPPKMPNTINVEYIHLYRKPSSTTLKWLRNDQHDNCTLGE